MNHGQPCPDCLADGNSIPTIWDKIQAGFVCAACGRVYVPGLPFGMHHYVDKPSAMRAMKRNKIEEVAQSVSTAAVVDRIMKDQF